MDEAIRKYKVIYMARDYFYGPSFSEDAFEVADDLIHRLEIGSLNQNAFEKLTRLKPKLKDYYALRNQNNILNAPCRGRKAQPCLYVTPFSLFHQKFFP